ncbi:MAG: twin-arginine translocation signal domain-containing protein, partial [Dongiaceae bacterium]
MAKHNETNSPIRRSVTRRDVVRAAGAIGVAAGVGPFFHVRPARAAKTLRILQWSHFVPGYDKWFDESYVKEWGQKNDTEVVVDHVGVAVLNSRAAAEVSAQQGHDLFMFLWPPPTFEDQVIDHAEIYQECESKYGKPIDLAIRSSYNPKTKKYYGFSDSYVPDPINYR